MKLPLIDPLLERFRKMLTVSFYWDTDRETIMLNYIAWNTDQETYLELTRELLNIYLNNTQLVPRSTYGKAIGEGVRSIT